jgi:hypothetical protein
MLCAISTTFLVLVVTIWDTKRRRQATNAPETFSEKTYKCLYIPNFGIILLNIEGAKVEIN